MTAVAPGKRLLHPLASTVDVSLLSLDVAPEDLDRLQALLSPDEVDRAARLRFERGRERFVAGRGQLRQALGALLGVDPSDVAFRYGRWGKPELPVALGVCFNLSHSDDAALLAVAHGCISVGIDIERRRDDVNAVGIARRFFSPGEVRRFLALADDSSRIDAFYRCWTRKEAVLKAMGAGLSVNLDAFEVTFDDPTAPAELVWSGPAMAVPARTRLVDLTSAIATLRPGYAAALAVVGTEPDDGRS